jgi:cytochrome P450
MQTLDTLTLPHLAMDQPDFAADPLPRFAEARAVHPWLAKSSFGLVVHEFTAMRELFGMDKQMRPSYDGIVDIMGGRGTPWGRFTEEQIIALPDADHDRIRGIFAPRFTPRYANEMRGMMRETISDLLDEWAPKGAFDFEDFAAQFPIRVMFRLVGAPVEDVAEIIWALETHGLAFGMNQDLMPQVQKAVEFEDAFVQRLVDRRRSKPRQPGEQQDLLDLMLEAQAEGGIRDRELLDMLIFIFVAGYDTSKNVLTYMMYLMTQYPEHYRRCAEDLEFCRKCVEETLRYYNPGTTFRFVNEDMVYRDVLLPKDTMLFFPLSVSGRDPGTFEQAESFDPERPVEGSKRHIAFGLGKHICLGQYIARAQLQEGLHLIAQRIREPKTAGPSGWRPFFGVWGIKGLPIEFTPG